MTIKTIYRLQNNSFVCSIFEVIFLFKRNKYSYKIITINNYLNFDFFKHNKSK